MVGDFGALGNSDAFASGASSATYVHPELEPLELAPVVRRALVLEDDDVERELLVRRLQLVGLQVVEASTIAQARAHLKSSQFDLAVMDVHLPDGCGLSFCEEALETASSLPVIILSSVRDSSVVRRSRAAGGLFFLGKPYDPNVLLAIIENAVGL